MIWSTTRFFLCVPFFWPLKTWHILCVFCWKLLYAISCVQFSELVGEGEDWIGWWREGHIGSVAEINFTGVLSSLVTNRALTAPELKHYTGCERWRLLSFVVQNTLNVRSSFSGGLYELYRFPCQFGAFGFGRCIPNLNVLLLERWIDAFSVSTKQT